MQGYIQEYMNSHSQDVKAYIQGRRENWKILKEKFHEMGIIEFGSDAELYAYFIRRQNALDAKLKDNQSYRKNCPKRPAKLSRTFHYFDPEMYKGEDTVSYPLYMTNRYIYSVEGGNSAQDTYLQNAKGKNPLGLNKCPEGNNSIVLEERLLQRGGYHPRTRPTILYEEPPTVSVINTYAYEFENLKPKNIQDEIIGPDKVKDYLHPSSTICPFLIKETPGNSNTLRDPRFVKIGVGIKNGQFTKNDGSDSEVTNIYLDTLNYSNFVEMNLHQQMRDLVISHWKAGIPVDLQAHLTLPGMGCFANFNVGEMHPIFISIMPQLAPVAARAYKKAITEFAKEQESIITEFYPATLVAKITAIRLTCLEHDSKENMHPENQAISDAFEDLKCGKTFDCNGIAVEKTHQLVDDVTNADGSIIKGRKVAPFSNVDPRAEETNELGGASQEAGIGENAEDLWYTGSPLYRPFELLSTARPHQTLGTCTK